MPSLLATLTIFGIGIPLILTPSFAYAISSVPAQKAGVAIGITLRILAEAIVLALIHLLTNSVRMAKLLMEGERLATIASFSTVHFALGFLVIATFAATFILHSRKSAHHIPEFPSESWD